MKFGVVGINHKLAALKLREKLAKVCGRKFGPGDFISAKHAYVLLSTCNRTEIYFCSDDLTETHTDILNSVRSEIEEEFDQKLYSFFGHDCMAHLSRVAAGLDSAIPFETEIQGQVKAAYHLAKKFHCLPSHLHFLFQKALKNGKLVRSHLPLQRGLPDIEHAIFEMISDKHANPTSVSCLFVGASAINLKILNYLKAKRITNITLINRTHSKAEVIREKYDVKIVAWDQLKNCQNYNILIFGTKSPNPLITELKCPKKLIFDLSVPRNVCPSLSKQHHLIDIDVLNRRSNKRKTQTQNLLNQAESLIEEAIKRQLYRFLPSKDSKHKIHIFN